MTTTSKNTEHPSGRINTMAPQSKIDFDIKVDRNVVNVYCCCYDPIGESLQFHRYHSLLSQAEKKRWQSIRTEEGKLCFLVSRAMIRTLLGTAINCSPTELIISADSQGKPFIESPGTHWNFNLSHSRGLIAMTLAYDISLGIDIEYCSRKRDFLQLARHAFHPIEIKQLETLPVDKQQHYFYKLWTLKEAYLKAIGTGLSYSLDSFCFNFQGVGCGLTMTPPPQQTANSWSGQLEGDYALACITLGESTEPQQLVLHNYLPLCRMTPLPLDSLVHNVISPSQPSQN